jgi:hypothetical protein
MCWCSRKFSASCSRPSRNKGLQRITCTLWRRDIYGGVPGIEAHILVWEGSVLIGRRGDLIGRDILIGRRDILIGRRDILIGRRDILIGRVDGNGDLMLGWDINRGIPAITLNILVFERDILTLRRYFLMLGWDINRGVPSKKSWILIC